MQSLLQLAQECTSMRLFIVFKFHSTLLEKIILAKNIA